MGSEIAVPVFGSVVLIVAIYLAVVTIRDRRQHVSEASTLGLGRGRIALGYLGALAASIPAAIWMAADDAQSQVRNDYISAEQAAQYWPGWILNFYCLLTPFAMVLITVIGLPLLGLLRKVRLASVAGALGGACILAFAVYYWEDAISALNIGIFALVTAGFVLAARLPWLLSPKLPARETCGSEDNVVDS